MQKEDLKVNLSGTHIVDKITNVKTGKVEVVERDCNIVVDSILPLIMAMLKGSLAGIKYWAVGSGSSSWDSTPVSPLSSEVKLTNEIGRVPVKATDITFLDPDTNEESSTPTTVIQVVSVFTETDCNGKWREFGIFGGNATSSANSGYMIDKKHHALLTKTEDMIVERKIILSISF